MWQLIILLSSIRLSASPSVDHHLPTGFAPRSERLSCNMFRQYPVLAGSPSPRARTVNANQWVQSAQEESVLTGRPSLCCDQRECRSIPARRSMQSDWWSTDIKRISGCGDSSSCCPPSVYPLPHPVTVHWTKMSRWDKTE